MSLEQAIQSIEELKGQGRRILVERLIEEAKRLTDSPIAYYAILNQDTTELTMLAWTKSAHAQCSVIDTPIVYPLEATGLWGDCVRERAPIITNDYEGCTRPTKKGHPEGHLPVTRHMNVCQMEGKTMRGILGVGNREGDYDDAHARTLQELANGSWKTIVAEPNTLGPEYP